MTGLSFVLALPPLATDRARPLLVALPPRLPRRQLRLQPTELFLDRNRSLRLLDAKPKPKSEPAPAAEPAPRARRRRSTQLRMSLPCAPDGKGKSMGTAPLSRAERAESKAIKRAHLPVLPATRGECLSFRAGNPCPFVSCRHHLYLDVNPESGAIKVNFPGLERMELAEPWPRQVRRVRVDGRQERLLYSGPPRQHVVLDLSLMEDTCSIDVGDRGEKRHDPLDIRRRQIRLEDVGRKMRLTMERARQLLEYAQAEALTKATDGQDVRPLDDDDPNAAERDET